MAFAKLDPFAQQKILARLETRRQLWCKAQIRKLNADELVLIVGDRPGPSAPKEPGYHHVPFYSTKHCSGWLNKQLEFEGIPEEKLIWLNSADENGNFYDIGIIEAMQPDVIIAMGGNAQKWLTKHGF